MNVDDEEGGCRLKTKGAVEVEEDNIGATEGGGDRATPESSLLILPFPSQIVEFCGSSVTSKCSLPNRYLKMLITIANDEDLVIIIEEYKQALSQFLKRTRMGK
ncbi:hypothetical protein K1719_018212 [Acacia pycnantha]|nr:hypothetical protein K1719_018212 [Acacia pycnantha]